MIYVPFCVGAVSGDRNIGLKKQGQDFTLGSNMKDELCVPSMVCRCPLRHVYTLFDFCHERSKGGENESLSNWIRIFRAKG